jgi:hypothetical protein
VCNVDSGDDRNAEDDCWPDFKFCSLFLAFTSFRSSFVLFLVVGKYLRFSFDGLFLTILSKKNMSPQNAFFAALNISFVCFFVMISLFNCPSGAQTSIIICPLRLSGCRVSRDHCRSRFGCPSGNATGRKPFEKIKYENFSFSQFTVA